MIRQHARAFLFTGTLLRKLAPRELIVFTAADVLLALRSLTFFVVLGAGIDLARSGGAPSHGALLLGLFLIFAQALRHVRRVTRDLLKVRFKFGFRGLIHDRCVELGVAHCEAPEIASTVHRARDRASLVLELFFLASAMIGYAARAGVSVLAVLPVAPWYVPLALLASLPKIAVSRVFAAREWRIYTESTERLRIANAISSALVTPARLLDSTFGGLTKRLQTRYRKLIDAWVKTRRQLAVSKALGYFATDGLSLGVAAIGIYAVLDQVGAGGMSAGAGLVYVKLVLEFNGAVDDLVGELSNASESVESVSAIDTFLTDGPQVQTSERARPSSRPPPGALVSMRGASFQYPSQGRTLLEEVDLFIAPGDRILLTGPNGAGKTSLLKMLTGIYAPTRGSVDFLDARSGRPLSRAEWQEQISVMFHDFAGYGFMSVADNLSVEGLPPHFRRSETIETLLSPVMAALPRGLNTFASEQHIDGVRLSAGMWQRIGLARAILRRPAALFLDEPTAHLDDPSILETVCGALPTTAIVVVSHQSFARRPGWRVLQVDGGSVRHTHEPDGASADAAPSEYR